MEAGKRRAMKDCLNLNAHVKTRTVTFLLSNSNRKRVKAFFSHLFAMYLSSTLEVLADLQYSLERYSTCQFQTGEVI